MIKRAIFALALSAASRRGLEARQAVVKVPCRVEDDAEP
jgi:hypothetical protein